MIDHFIPIRKILGAYLEEGALPWVQHPHLFVLAGREDPGAVPVPADAVDDISVYAVDPQHLLSTRHVPQDHHVITACKRAAERMVGNTLEIP